jgi:hypothetical protein
MKRRPLISLGAALCLAAGFMAAGAQAQSYPTKPIRLIVQLTAELFKSQANVFVVHIPYKGTALAIPDLISGKVDVLFDSLPTGLPHVKEGRLRALGVTSAKRTPLAPDLPAISDVLPGYESTTWFGIFGPRGLSPEVVTRVNMAASQVLKDPEVVDRLTRLGIEPIGGTPAQFAAMLTTELAKWKNEETWDNLMFALRLGQRPQCVITTTPRSLPLLQHLVNRPDAIVSQGHTFDNANNLAPSFLAYMKERYEGTRLGRQELSAEILRDVAGALW